MLELSGCFTIDGIIVPNLITRAGAQEFLKQAVRADDTAIGHGGNWFVGLTDELGVDHDADLTDLVGEPTSAGGYARIAVTRDSTGWPTVDLINGVARARSKTSAFTASGADFSRAITRAFLCNVASGSAGILFAISGRLATPLLILDSTTHNVIYELFWKVS